MCIWVVIGSGLHTVSWQGVIVPGDLMEEAGFRDRNRAAVPVAVKSIGIKDWAEVCGCPANLTAVHQPLTPWGAMKPWLHYSIGTH